jgi:hypothetical protein
MSTAPPPVFYLLSGGLMIGLTAAYSFNTV